LLDESRFLFPSFNSSMDYGHFYFPLLLPVLLSLPSSGRIRFPIAARVELQPLTTSSFAVVYLAISISLTYRWLREKHYDAASSIV
jgi:hypothetical protein